MHPCVHRAGAVCVMSDVSDRSLASYIMYALYTVPAKKGSSFEFYEFNFAKNTQGFIELIYTSCAFLHSVHVADDTRDSNPVCIRPKPVPACDATLQF